MTLSTPRMLWTLFEPVHAVVYFAPQARAAFEDAGLRGFWRGYFAGRAAPLGAVGAAPVVAAFYGFEPRMVHRALPAVWDLATPAAALDARERGAVDALRALLAGRDDVPAERLARIAETLGAAVERADLGGRPLGAANAALPRPREPLAAAFHAATALRELRGDGHVAALLTAGLSGLDALVLRCGADLDRARVQPARGWTDEQWDATADDLRVRGLLDAGARLTPSGRSILDDVETVTDRLAAQPWQGMDDDALAEVAALVTPLAAAARAALPAATPIGLPSASP